MTADDQLIAMLADSPGFPVVISRLDREFERRASILTATFVTSGNPVDQRAFDFERGFMAGAQWFVREMAKKERQLMEENQEEEVSV